MRTGLTIQDLGDLLEKPIVAVLATYRRDGTVMLSPVWFDWTDGAFSVWIGGHEEGKARHVAADPRVSLVVAEQTLPYRGVEVSGRATLTPDGFADVIRRTGIKYYGPEKGNAFADGYGTEGLLIHLVPERIRAWDFRDDVEAADAS